MASTKITDLAIVPETFHEYVEKLIMKRSAAFRSGLVANVPSFIPSKGTSVNAPAFLGFDGADEVLSDVSALTVNNVDSINAIAAINFRGKAFGANDLVGQLAGQDPLGNLASKVADYWVRQYNSTLTSVLIGATSGVEAALPLEVVNDQSGNVISADHVIDTKGLMGEYGDELTIMVCHSAVFNSLQKTDLTKDVLVDSQGSPIGVTYRYMGMEVVVDDQIPAPAGVHKTYFCKPGAITYAQGIDPSLAIETDRDILAGDDIVTTRSRYIMHANGSSWVGAPAGVSPTNAELSTGLNYLPEDPAESRRLGIRTLLSLA